MTDRVHYLAIAGSVLLLVAVLELVRRRKLSEEYSFLWILFGMALLAVSVRRDILDVVARWLGIYYPPIVLVLLLIVMVFLASLSFAVILSRHRRQIERLIEETAILGAEVQQLRQSREAEAEKPREVVVSKAAKY